MYPEALVQPMRQELVRLGFEELRDASDVERAIGEASQGTTLAVVNSVCGCAAANARPGVAMALRWDVRPDRLVTVFAGQDQEATARFRQHLAGIPPSSPFMALLRDGDPVFVLQRRDIEGRSASAIAADLTQAFQRFCGPDAPGGDGAADRPAQEEGEAPSTFRSIL